MSTEQGNAGGKQGETSIGASSVSLAPQWLNEGARGGAAAGWRPSGAMGSKAPSRFDTGNPGQRWREEERPPAQRREPTRWTGAGGEPERWGEGGAGRGYTEPFGGGGSTMERWGSSDALGRGRGRPSEVDSWKQRETDWRAPADPAGPQPRTDWRSDRWGTAPGAVRADSWRAGGPSGRGFGEGPVDGGGRGFGGMGRGRGLRTGGSFSSLKAGGGGIGGTVKLGRSRALYRYPTDELSRLYRQLLASGRLKLPAVVERDDPLLFLADGEFLDVMEQFIGTDPAEAAEAFTAHYAALERQYSRPYAPTRPEGEQLQAAPLGGAPLAEAAAADAEPTAAPAPAPAVALELDQWVYKDPQGVVQGPFPKQDIIEWYEGGFFPLELPIRNANDLPDAAFRPLSALLRIWTTHAAPPGFAAGAGAADHQPAGALTEAAAAPAQQQPQQAGLSGAENAQMGALNLPDDLHPQQGDVLSAALKQMEINAVAKPAPAPVATAPARSDPVVNPALIKRIPSDKRLAALAAPQQAAPGAGLMQQGSVPLTYAAPGAPIPVEALEAFPFLQQPQQLPQQHLQHPMASAGGYPLGHTALGLQGRDNALLPPQHALAPGHTLAHTHAHQQQLPLAAQMHAMPPQQQEPHGPPASAWGHGMPQGLQQQQQPLAPQPAQSMGALSLLDIQREEQQAAEAARIAAAAAAAQQQQQPQAPMALHYEAPAPPAPKAPAPSAPKAATPAAPSASPAPQPAPAPEEPLAAEQPRPETKVAPWAATAAPKSQTGTSKSLLQIQEEEAERQARLVEQEAAAAAVATAAAAAAPAGPGWAKGVAAGVVGMVARAKSLKQIQEEEMRQAGAAKAAAAVQQQQQAAAVAARAGPTLGDVIDRQRGAAVAPPAKTVWGVSSTSGKAPSLRDVMHYEESAADLEGGAPTDFQVAAPAVPVQTRALAGPPALVVAAAEEGEEDEMLFWDYGAPPAKAGAAAQPAAPAPLMQAPAAQPVKPARWAAAAATPSVAPVAPAAVVPPPAAKVANGPAAKPAPAPAPAPAAAKPHPAAPAQPAAAAAPALAPAPAPSEPGPAGSMALAGAFREWCSQQMRALSGSDDVTLCEFLVTVEANSEVAEYITMYLGSSPAVSRFSAEFMKRKLAEAANAGKKGKKTKKSGTAAASAAAPSAAGWATPAAAAPVVGYSAASAPAMAAPTMAAAAVPAAPAAAAPPRYVGATATGLRAAPAPAPSEFPSLGIATGKAAKKEGDWEKIPKSTAGGKKKKGKGLKVDSTLLGFGTGTNYSVLETPE